MPDVLRFVVYGLAVYRLARLVAIDTITDPLRKAIGKLAAGKAEYSLSWLLAELVNCPYCVAVWFSFFALPFLFLQVQVIDYIAVALALAGIQSVLQDIGGQNAA